jgi:hypothetical protein
MQAADDPKPFASVRIPHRPTALRAVRVLQGDKPPILPSDLAIFGSLRRSVSRQPGQCDGDSRPSFEAEAPV